MIGRADHATQCLNAQRSAAIAKRQMVPFRDWYDGKRVYHDFVLQEPLPAPLQVNVRIWPVDWSMSPLIGLNAGMLLVLGFYGGFWFRDHLRHCLTLAAVWCWDVLRWWLTS